MLHISETTSQRDPQGCRCSCHDPQPTSLLPDWEILSGMLEAEELGLIRLRRDDMGLLILDADGMPTGGHITAYGEVAM